MLRLPLAATLLAAVLLAPAAHTQFRGAWLPPERSLTVQTYLAYSDNTSWFCGENLGHCQEGSRGPISDTVDGERALTNTLGAKVEIAPVSFLSVIADLPFHRLDYDKDFGAGQLLAIDSRGVGDLKLSARTGRTFGLWSATAGYGLELPTGDFTNLASVVPLGQGTVNHEIYVEAGRSLYPWDAFVEAGALLRLRNAYENEFGDVIDWGDEWHGQLKAGYGFARAWMVQGVARGFRSGFRTTNVPGEPRDQYWSAFELVPGILWRPAWGWAELWVRIPVSGRNAPADPSIGLSVTYRHVWERSAPNAP